MTSITHYAGDNGIMNFDTPDVDIRRLVVGPEWYEWKGEADKIRSLYVIKGGGVLNGKTIEEDDYIIMDEGEDVSLLAHELMDVFAMTVPEKPAYDTYARRFV